MSRPVEQIRPGDRVTVFTGGLGAKHGTVIRVYHGLSGVCPWVRFDGSNSAVPVRPDECEILIIDEPARHAGDCWECSVDAIRERFASAYYRAPVSAHDDIECLLNAIDSMSGGEVPR